MNDNKRIIIFLIVALTLCISWFFLYDFWLSDYDPWLAIQVAEHSVIFLDLIRYNAEINYNTVLIDGEAMVIVDAACNGMVLLALFTGFILAFPGPWLKKLLYIPLGMVAIHLVNVLRVGVLALNVLYNPATLDFNHKYTYTIVVYAFILFLWMLWVKRFSGLNQEHVLPEPAPEHQAA